MKKLIKYLIIISTFIILFFFKFIIEKAPKEIPFVLNLYALIGLCSIIFLLSFHIISKVFNFKLKGNFLKQHIINLIEPESDKILNNRLMRWTFINFEYTIKHVNTIVYIELMIRLCLCFVFIIDVFMFKELSYIYSYVYLYLFIYSLQIYKLALNLYVKLTCHIVDDRTDLEISHIPMKNPHVDCNTLINSQVACLNNNQEALTYYTWIKLSYISKRHDELGLTGSQKLNAKFLIKTIKDMVMQATLLSALSNLYDSKKNKGFISYIFIFITIIYLISWCFILLLSIQNLNYNIFEVLYASKLQNTEPFSLTKLL